MDILLIILFTWPIAALVVSVFVGRIGVKKLAFIIQENTLSSKYAWLCLAGALVSSAAIYLMVFLVLPKDCWGHPFFGPYGFFMAAFLAQVLASRLFLSISQRRHSLGIQMFAWSVLAGVLAVPGVLLVLLIYKDLFT